MPIFSSNTFLGQVGSFQNGNHSFTRDDCIIDPGVGCSWRAQFYFNFRSCSGLPKKKMDEAFPEGKSRGEETIYLLLIK
jgi:hypothetical protein